MDILEIVNALDTGDQPVAKMERLIPDKEAARLQRPATTLGENRMPTGRDSSNGQSPDVPDFPAG